MPSKAWRRGRDSPLSRPAKARALRAAPLLSGQCGPAGGVHASRWWPREDSNLRLRVRSPASCSLNDRAMVPAAGVHASTRREAAQSSRADSIWPGRQPASRPSEGRVLCVERREEVEPPGRVEPPLAAYRAAALLSVGGVVTSRGIEPRSLGLRPSAMTTRARWSEFEPTAGVEPAPAPYGGAVFPITLRRHGPGSRTRTPIPRSSAGSPAVGRSLVGPGRWSRTSVVTA